jgi:hypothetical protein
VIRYYGGLDDEHGGPDPDDLDLDEMEDDAAVSLGNAVPKTETAAALLVMLTESMNDLWVPKSCIHDESECYSMKSGPGVLKVLAWWARKNPC